MTDRDSARRLGSLIPMLLFILFFVMCSGVLAAVFLRSAQISANAGRRSDAVQLCRNQAERFRSGEAIPQGKTYLRADFTQTDPEHAAYYLEVTCSRVGGVDYAGFTVCTADAAPLYSLEAARYPGEGR